MVNLINKHVSKRTSLRGAEDDEANDRAGLDEIVSTRLSLLDLTIGIGSDEALGATAAFSLTYRLLAGTKKMHNKIGLIHLIWR